ncbi:MAG TPA: hypothetical protein PK280_11030 [Planctomycetota bacterium]|nr:hypothetical protein [Planctomycetota bacterium]
MSTPDLAGFYFSVLRPGAPERHVAFSDGRAAAWGLAARLALDGDRLDLEIEGSGPAVATVWLQPGFANAFPLLPGFMIGDNRPEDTGPGYPQLAARQDLATPRMLSPFWGIRADRATAPVAFLFGDEGMRALAVPPYSGEANGLRLCLSRGIGISIGHVVEPVQYVHDGAYGPAVRGYHEFRGSETFVCRHFSSASGDRRGHAPVIRRLCELMHEEAPPGDGVRATVKMLADAMVTDVLTPASTTHATETGGELFKIKDGKPARTLTEIGWTGGAMAAYPFLLLQKRYARPELGEYAVRRLDRIARGVNPASGFFWDCQDGERGHARGWWTELSPEAHYAYTNGHACYYLLRSADLVPERAPAWIAAARRVLDRALELRLADGKFPVSFALESGEPLRAAGFAGCWFAAALAQLHRHTGEKRYRDAALRAASAYGADVAALAPCATPMDTHNATDEEGNLALLHLAHALHAGTGDADCLAMLRDSAEFEMLWRYAYNTKPILPPLDRADWGSSGGSVTSAHNPHIHPMHLNALDPVLYLGERTGDPYWIERTRDAVRYGCCCVCRPSEDFGWGRPGWLCERFCPSDGLLIQQDLRTGEPRSVGCDYHPWTVAVTLEGLCGGAWERFPELG